MKLIKPFFIRALEACATLDVNLNNEHVEKARREEHPPWIADNMENIITRMIAVPKGAGTARLKAKLEQTIEEKRLQKFTRVYTDGSVMEDRVKCLVICGPEEIKIRLAEQTCIFNAETQATIKAIKATKR
jgi:ribonuclease HI